MTLKDMVKIKVKVIILLLLKPYNFAIELCYSSDKLLQYFKN